MVQVFGMMRAFSYYQYFGQSGVVGRWEGGCLSYRRRMGLLMPSDLFLHYTTYVRKISFTAVAQDSVQSILCRVFIYMLRISPSLPISCAGTELSPFSTSTSAHLTSPLSPLSHLSHRSAVKFFPFDR